MFIPFYTNEMKVLFSLLYVFFLIFTSSSLLVAGPLEKLEDLPATSLLYLDADDQVILSKDAQKLLIPASTIKLLTALIAIDTWGLQHRFSTEFYFDEDTHFIWVKGLADPFLISEEIDLIVELLSQHEIDAIKGVGIDESYFSKNIVQDGRSKSDNPYDAPVSALAANFNTINLKIDEGLVSSQELQTPITPLARKLALSYPNGKHRINLGLQENGGRYFSEVLTAKLKKIGIRTDNTVISDRVPVSAKLLFEYRNSHDLKHVLTAMLEYSNNFIASQLYLSFGAHKFGMPANSNKSKQAVIDYIGNKFNWQNYELFDGAGLSRKNKLSAEQLIDVLTAFQDYIELMPVQNDMVIAKTGTLHDVSTYAGYIKREQKWAKFAFMSNQVLEHRFREKLAEQLSRY